MNYYDALLTEIPSDFGTVVIGLQTYTLKVEGQSDTTLTNAVQRTPKETQEMEPTDGQVIQEDRILSFSARLTGQVQPPLGSVLVDPYSEYWTILRVQRIELTQVFRCYCRNLSIVNNASGPNAGLNTVTILKAQYVKGKANEAKACWLGYISGLKIPTTLDQVTCRLQPSSTDAMIRFTAEWSKETIRAIFQSQLPINIAEADYRLVDLEGNHYRIMAYFDAERIDKLPTAICVAITEGIEYFNGGTSGPPPLPPPVFPTGEGAKRKVRRR